MGEKGGLRGDKKLVRVVLKNSKLSLNKDGFFFFQVRGGGRNAKNLRIF